MNPPFPQQLRGVRDRPQPEPVPSAAQTAIKETALLSLALFLYLFVRNLIRDKADIAYVNADRLIDWERRLGLFLEPRLQEWALQHSWLITGVNWIYVWTYWPTLAGTMLWLFFKHRTVLQHYRNALLASGSIGLVGFATFPLAPPRFLSSHGFVDTVAKGSEAYATLYPSSVANWYAAMPSLHVGWTLLMGVAIATRARNPIVRGLGIVLPLAMFAATVLTANHYLADGIVGAGVALVGLLIARMLGGLNDRRQGVRSY